MNSRPSDQHRRTVCLAILLAALTGITLGGCTAALAPSDETSLETSGGDAAAGRPADDSGTPVPGPSDPVSDDERPGPPPFIGDDSEGAPDSGGIGMPEGDPRPAAGGTPGEIQSGTLTAGSFDDNLNYEVFQDFVSDMLQNDPDGLLPDVSLGQRVVITVSNESGEPIGDARVLISPTGEGVQPAVVLLDTTTGSDGRVLFLTGVDGPTDATEFSVTVEPPNDMDPVTQPFALESQDWGITVQGAAAQRPAQLDLAFVVDATGSMADELEYLKIEMDSIAAAVADEFPNVDQRYALIVYRDEGDIYVTRTFDFTSSLVDFQANLAEQRASGGGDYPEAVHLALEEANGLAWREQNTARVLFLVADAPPHSEFAQRALDGVVALRKRGVAVYPVAASGVAEEAELLMRTAALMTLSEYIFLTDDSGVGNPHAEPHIPCYHVQRLDQIMIRMIESELAGAALQPEPDDIIRTVGNPVNGVCTGDEAEAGGDGG